MNTRTAQTGNTDPLDAQAHGKPAPASDAAQGAVSAWAMVGLLAGPFLSMVDSSIFNVALPDIAQQAQSPLATAQWITSGYLLALAIVLPTTAFLAKRFGTARFDPIGLAMLAAGFGLAIYGATLGAQGSWLDRAVWPFWAAGACLLAVYLLWAVWRPHPAVDLKLLRHPQSALALLLSALASLVMFAMLFLLPFVMQDLQGSSPE